MNGPSLKVKMLQMYEFFFCGGGGYLNIYNYHLLAHSLDVTISREKKKYELSPLEKNELSPLVKNEFSPLSHCFNRPKVYFVDYFNI